MKKNLIWILLVLGAGTLGFTIGVRQTEGFEFRVNVSGDSVDLESSDGCNWTTAHYGSTGMSEFTFVVDETGVRSPASNP